MVLIFQNLIYFGITGSGANTTVNVGVFGNAANVERNTGVGGAAITPNTFTSGENNGGYFKADKAKTTQGLFAHALGGTTVSNGGAFVADGSTTNHGVLADAHGGNVNFGVRGTTSGASASTIDNYAIYGATTQNSSVCSTGTALSSCTQAAGYFNGDVFVVNGSYWTSDSTLKTNITSVQNSSQILSQINVYSYQFDTNKTSGMNVPAGSQIGFLSQQVLPIMPSLVKRVANPETIDTSGNIIAPRISYLGVNYPGFVPLLVAGHNEQQMLIDSLITRISNLETIVYNCCNMLPKSSGQNNTQSTELKNSPVTTIFLDQNRPNPYQNQCDIDYYLPDEVRIAEMLFYDQTGKNIKTVTLKDRGKGTLHVYSPELKTGTYTYSLLADGQVVETKTMVKVK